MPLGQHLEIGTTQPDRVGSIEMTNDWRPTEQSFSTFVLGGMGHSCVRQRLLIPCSWAEMEPPHWSFPALGRFFLIPEVTEISFSTSATTSNIMKNVRGPGCLPQGIICT
jgi:hypothetical protein